MSSSPRLVMSSSRPSRMTLAAVLRRIESCEVGRGWRLFPLRGSPYWRSNCLAMNVHIDGLCKGFRRRGAFRFRLDLVSALRNLDQPSLGSDSIIWLLAWWRSWRAAEEGRHVVSAESVAPAPCLLPRRPLRLGWADPQARLIVVFWRPISGGIRVGSGQGFP